MIQRPNPETSLSGPFRKMESGVIVWITQSMFSQEEGMSEGYRKLAKHTETGNSQWMRRFWGGMRRVR